MNGWTFKLLPRRRRIVSPAMCFLLLLLRRRRRRRPVGRFAPAGWPRLGHVQQAAASRGRLEVSPAAAAHASSCRSSRPAGPSQVRRARLGRSAAHAKSITEPCRRRRRRQNHLVERSSLKFGQRRKLLWPEDRRGQWKKESSRPR